jgi:predicted nucleic acid-binding protein
MSATIAVDTSVAVPLLLQSHDDHGLVHRWWGGTRELVLSGHALAETYSVMTRLPGDLRVEPEVAARVIAERFGPPLVLARRTASHLLEVLSRLAIGGGAVYDALVALAAKEHGSALATRDARAKATYEAVGAEVIVVG